MEDIKITFLGTGSATPTKKRNHTSILLSYKNENILIDCGEGTQRQFKFANLSPSKISKILITHIHGDHILGLPGLFQTLIMNGYSKTLEIYGPKTVPPLIKNLKKIFNLKINLKITEAKQKLLETKEFYLTSAHMTHGTPALAYSFTIKDKLRLNKLKIKKLKIPNSPILKQLSEGKDIILNKRKIKSAQVSYLEKGKKITFILDTSLNTKAIDLAKNSDLLICESSFTQEEKDKAIEYKHLTAHDAATIANKSKSKKLILIHLSQRHEHNTKHILTEAKKVFKNASIARDLDTIKI